MLQLSDKSSIQNLRDYLHAHVRTFRTSNLTVDGRRHLETSLPSMEPKVLFTIILGLIFSVLAAAIPTPTSASLCWPSPTSSPSSIVQVTNLERRWFFWNREPPSNLEPNVIPPKQDVANPEPNVGLWGRVKNAVSSVLPTFLTGSTPYHSPEPAIVDQPGISPHADISDILNF